MAAAGVAIALASLWQTFVSGFLIGGALFFLGIGEWNNHQHEKKEKQTAPEGMIGFRMYTTRPWSPTILGVIFDLIGIVIAGLLIYRLVMR